MVDPQARITIIRESAEDLGLREIFISLDGDELAILRHGERVSRHVTPGPHRVRAHNTLFWKNLDVELRPGEQATFVVVNRPGWGTYSMTAVIGAGPVYLTFERAE